MHLAGLINDITLGESCARGICDATHKAIHRCNNGVDMCRVTDPSDAQQQNPVEQKSQQGGDGNGKDGCQAHWQPGRVDESPGGKSAEDI